MPLSSMPIIQLLSAGVACPPGSPRQLHKESEGGGARSPQVDSATVPLALPPPRFPGWQAARRAA